MKISEFTYTIDDVITTDRYLKYCQTNHRCYIKTDYFYIGNFNWRGVTHPTHIDKICVSGHSDYPITSDIAQKFRRIFCVNKDCDASNCYGIPLGIGNDCNDSPQHKIYGNLNILSDCQQIPKNKETLLYMNFNTSTYPIEREYVHKLFSSIEWVKEGNIDNTLVGRISYLEDMKKSKFVLCPRGNGIDTHRLWEALYVGSIPIVKYHKNSYDLFSDLPILFVDSWEIINEEFLVDIYRNFINIDWTMEKLKISYWENFITEHAK